MIRVQNLGWLLRNWKLIRRLEVREHSTRTLKAPGLSWDAYLIAYGETQSVRGEPIRFETDFACKEILARWLNRSIFRGLPILWFGQAMKVGDEEYRKLKTA